jgi:putative membrane protein
MNESSRSDPRLEDWQRLAPMSLLFLIIGGSIKFVKENLFMFAGAGAGFAFLDRLGLREFVLLGALGLLGAVLTASVYHRRFRFRVEDDAIRVRRGLFEINDLRVRFARVQNVGLNQPLYFRPFGLVRFQLETPGAESTEVELPGIREDLANALRDRIASFGNDPLLVAGPDNDPFVEGVAEQSPASEALLHAPTGARLFMHGLVSNQVWVIAGLAAWLFGVVSERMEGRIDEMGLGKVLEGLVDFGWIGMVAFLLTLVGMLFVMSGAIAWLRYQGFSLKALGDRVVATSGLAERREQSVRQEKLTGITIHQTALGRLLGQRYLVARQARSEAADLQASRAQFLVPGVSERDLGLVTAMMPSAEFPGKFNSVSRRFFYLFGSRLGALVVLGFGLLWWRFPEAGRILALGPFVLGLVLWLIYRRWRCWGWCVEGDHCWVQRGLLGLRQDVFAIPMVQQVRVVQTPYLRRHHLATVKLILPQGEQEIPLVPLEDAAALANLAIHAAETALVHRV